MPGLLNNLKSQTFKNFEVIHVDSNSDDRTCDKAAEFAGSLQIKTFCVKQRNVSYQRNFGAEQARGKWIIFMDADDLVKKTFLAQLRDQLHRHPNTDLFSCLLDDSTATPLQKNLLKFANFLMVATADIRPFAGGALIGIKRDKIDTLAFRCDARMSEDHLFLEDAIKRGYRYQIFKQPRYLYSMRRFDREGSLKIVLDYIQSTAVLLAGPRFDKFLPNYPMEGGSYYHMAQSANSQRYMNTLRQIFRGGCVFMLFEAVFHASGLRTAGVEGYWPVSAVAMVHLFVWLWASLSFLVALVLYYLQKYLERAQPLVVLLGLAAVVHSAVLVYLSFTPYSQLLPVPNLYGWIPFYSWWLRGEAATLLLIASFICYGKWKKYL